MMKTPKAIWARDGLPLLVYSANFSFVFIFSLLKIIETQINNNNKQYNNVNNIHK